MMAVTGRGRDLQPSSYRNVRVGSSGAACVPIDIQTYMIVDVSSSGSFVLIAIEPACDTLKCGQEEP